MKATNSTVYLRFKSISPKDHQLWISWLTCFFLSFSSFSQEQSLTLEITKAFEQQTSPEVQNRTRRMMFQSGENNIGNPIQVVFGGLMFLYQNVFSDQISAHCMYEISCSEYTKLNIEKNGLIRGSILGFHQLMHCTPSTTNEVPPYMYTPYSTKIANDVHQIR